jgi:hypothetical protein
MASQTTPATNPITSGGYDASSDIYSIVSLFLSDYIFPTIIALGLFNNVLVLIVMANPRYKNIVCCLYLQCLAMADLGSLVSYIPSYISDILPHLVAALGDPFCSILQGLGVIATTMSNWAIVLMTYTRFVAVVFPLKAGIWCTMKAAKSYIAFLLLFFTGFSVPFIVFYKASVSIQGAMCYFTMPIDVANAYMQSYTAICQISPFVLIVVFNGCIYYRLKRGADVKSITTQDKKDKDEATVMKMVVIVTITYLLLVFPFVFMTGMWYYNLNALTTLTPQQQALTWFGFKVTAAMYAVNNSVNLYLYCVCSKKFRNDLGSVILICSKR